MNAPAFVPFNLAAARAAFLRGDFAGVISQASGTHNVDVSRAWALAMSALYGPAGLSAHYPRDGRGAPTAAAKAMPLRWDTLGDWMDQAAAELADALGLCPLTIRIDVLDSLADARMFGFVERPAA